MPGLMRNVVVGILCDADFCKRYPAVRAAFEIMDGEVVEVRSDG